MKSNTEKLLSVVTKMRKKHFSKKSPIVGDEPEWHQAKRLGYKSQTRRENECGTVRNLSVEWNKSKQNYFLVYDATIYTGGQYHDGVCIPNNTSSNHVSVLIYRRNFKKIKNILENFCFNEVTNGLDGILLDVEERKWSN